MTSVNIVKSEEKVFVAHAEEDIEEVTKVLEPVRNLPINFYLALESAEVGRSSENARRHIKTSSLIIPYITENSKRKAWVNQEIGCAFGLNKEILPVFEQPNQLKAFIKGVEGVRIDRSDWDSTTYQLVSRLRAVFEPLQSELDTATNPLKKKLPDWGLVVQCNYDECNVEGSIDLSGWSQKELWEWHESGDPLVTTCRNCGTEYHFDPATLRFVGRIEP
jgi:hypothetical protein